ncbi:MAG: methylmalonyl Co-A mutase-associated GTPase MeaB, partial [Acidimicrobiia bacterium]|nr:methylmalonyl Co-A mutase-associated GTPase MeaB [Acidimicrobiia bacterium]
AEVEIVESADTTIVVLNPGWGDSVQANKAGLLEIGDMFVVNKADRPGSDETVRDLKQMLMMGEEGPWVPPIVLTVATKGQGLAELWSFIGNHRRHLEDSGRLDERRRVRLAIEIRKAVAEEVMRRSQASSDRDEFERAVDEAVARVTDPWSAARMLLG